MNQHVLLFAAACILHETANSAEYKFNLNGTPLQPQIVSLRGAPDQPAADDLVVVAGVTLTLGDVAEQEFRTTPIEDGRLMMAGKGGLQPVGARISYTYQRDKRVIRNPLARMTPDEIRQLRGIFIDDWDDEISASLIHINPDRACVTVQESFIKGNAAWLSALPKTLRYLQVEEQSNLGKEDYARLAGFKSLRFLAIHAMSRPIDIGRLQQASELRHLDLRGSQLKNASELGSLRGLRVLNLAFTRGVADVAFAGGLPSLAWLDIQGTEVQDLSPLESSRSLVSLVANQAPIETLPQRKLPTLRSLAVMSTNLDDKGVAAFSQLHPECRVVFHWKQPLDAALAAATRLRVRSGGTCHRDPARETTLFEIKNPAEIANLVERIAIDERRSGFHCMCCGTPSFEFYQGDRLLLTLGFHHGQGMRWPDVWPGDGALTSASADSLCQWLAEHGVKDPLQQRVEQKRMEESAQRRNIAYSALMPAKVDAQLKQARSAEEASKAFEDGIPDEKDRARLFLQLFGCDNGSWTHYNGLDEPLKELFLPGVSTSVLTAAILDAKDVQTVNGAARWLFGEAKWKSFDAKSLASLLPSVGKNALSHPRPYNRKTTIQTLGQIKTEESKRLLRSMLADEWKPRDLPRDEQTEPGGQVVFHPGGDELKATSDQALAGMSLAQIGDRASLPALRNLLMTASGRDKEVIVKAIGMLEKTK